MMGGTVDMEQKNDFLGRDPIGRLLWRMSLPAIVAQLINLLYNLVDRVYIGPVSYTHLDVYKRQI